MSQPWNPEIAISCQFAQQRIVEQHPEFRDCQIRELGVGWDNIAFLLDGEVVFRFPQRQMGADCMEAELNVLPGIQSSLPLPISAASWIGTATEHYPWRFGGYRILPGQTACQSNLTASEKEAFVEPLAKFLRALHDIDAEQALQRGAPTDAEIRRMDLPHRLKRTEEIFAKLAAVGPAHRLLSYEWVLEPIRAMVASGATLLPPMCLVHGDLYARHIVVQDDRSLAGVIDWGDVHAGHPAVDLALIHTFLPHDSHNRFYETYGPVPESWKQLARFRGLYHDATVLHYAIEIEDQGLIKECEFSLNNLLAQAS